MLAGYDIEEVPISWINRTIDMGSSSFRIARLAPSYFWTLIGMLLKSTRERKGLTPKRAGIGAGSSGGGAGFGS